MSRPRFGTLRAGTARDVTLPALTENVSMSTRILEERIASLEREVAS